MNFYIEPFLFAVNPEETDKDSFENYINTLIDWKDFNELNWGDMYILSSTYELLCNNGYYPFTDQLKILINRYNIDYISINDINKILTQFLTKLPQIDIEIDILFEYKNGSSNYDLSHRPNEFNNELYKLAGLLHLKKTIKSTMQSNNIMFTKNIICDIQFKSIFDVIENDTTITKYCSHTLPCFDSFKSFCEHSNTPLLIWKNASCKKDYTMALAACIMQHCNYQRISESIDNHNFVIQDSFIESISNYNFNIIKTRSLSVLRALEELILKLKLDETHWLRENKGPNSNQITDGNYKGWRKDIDYEFHLHYWQYNDELKFANIVPHNFFSISKE